MLVVGKPALLIVHPTNDRVEVTLLGEPKQWPEEEFFSSIGLIAETSEG
jgi:23S rRNA-/tRNA-specific pseudouridylate synthase